MATPTATDIARIFGQPRGSFGGGSALTPEQTGALTQFSQQGAAPQPVSGQTATSPITSFARPPSATPLAPVEPTPAAGAEGTTAPAPGPAPTRLPAPTRTTQPDQLSIESDPALLAQLRERAAGEGIGPSMEDVLASRSPEFQLIDRDFEEISENVASDLARRGVLEGGEALSALVDVRTEQGLRKANLKAILALEFNEQRNQNINFALQQLGVLDSNRVSAATSINVANIGAAAQVQSSQIAASATVSAARIGAEASKFASNANVQIAKIGAQAALQRADMDFTIANRTLDQNLSLQGIDPVRFESDPLYRGDVIAHRAFVQNAKEQLLIAQAAQEIFNI